MQKTMSKSSDSKSTTSVPNKMMKLIEIIRSKYGYGFTLSGMFFFVENFSFFSIFSNKNSTHIRSSISPVIE